MKRSIEWLIVSTGILFLMIVFLDFIHITKLVLFFIWSSWSVVVAMSYAILTREEVDCRCFEDVKE